VSIKIKVTDEMVQAYRVAYWDRPVTRSKGSVEQREQDGLRVVLDIVERDLNEAVSEFECGYFVHEEVKSLGCIEVEE